MTIFTVYKKIILQQERVSFGSHLQRDTVHQGKKDVTLGRDERLAGHSVSALEMLGSAAVF